MSLIEKLFKSKVPEGYNSLHIIETDENNNDIVLKIDTISEYNKRIEANPKDFEAFYFRGNGKSKAGDYTGAIEDYDIALKLNAKFTDAYFNRAVAKKKSENLKGALQDYTVAISLNTNFALAYNNR